MDNRVYADTHHGTLVQLEQRPRDLDFLKNLRMSPGLCNFGHINCTVLLFFAATKGNVLGWKR